MDRRLIWILGLGGAALAYHLYRKRRQPVKVVETVQGAGRTLTHYNGGISIKDRLRLIEEMVGKSVTNPAVREAAMEAVRHCPSRDRVCELRGVHDYVRRNVRYTGDLAPVLQLNGKHEPVDIYSAAHVTLKNGGGDCDDHTIVTRAMVAHLGIPMKSRAVKYQNRPWSHIYGVAKLKDKEIPLDTTLHRSKFGYEIPYSTALDWPEAK